MSNLKISVIPQFWKDWKQVHKKHKSREYATIYTDIEFSSASDEARIDSISVLNAIKNSIVNGINEGCLDGQSFPYDKQPFLSRGWQIRKKRWGTDTAGKSSGLRIIFCLNDSDLLFVYIATKANCANEKLLEKEFMGRINDYLSIST